MPAAGLTLAARQDHVFGMFHGMNAFLGSQTIAALRGRPRRWSRLLARIAYIERRFAASSDDELRKAALSLRYRAKSGLQVAALLPDVFALVRESARRVLGMRPYDVQVQGAVAMARGAIAEMQTGEGKTLTATLPLCLYALAGRGAHLVTANDYLARRDAELMRPLYECLGLRVGVLQSDSSPRERRRAYSCDVTYGTTREFGFDFLRDRLAARRADENTGGDCSSSSTAKGRRVQRGAFYALVDEADCVLIDEARTPLVIGTADRREFERSSECYRWAAACADQFREGRDYSRDHQKRSVELTPYGRQLARSLPAPELLHSIGLSELYESLERAISVPLNFNRDEHYVIRDGRVVIVDERTGRLAEGRQWQQGLHQAIEAREHLDLTVATSQAARITVQDLFLRYRHLSGMTGTASSSTREFRDVYRLRVVRIPTHRKSRRRRLPSRVFRSSEEKWSAIVKEVQQIHATGRPVLIGTRTIDASEHLSRLLAAAGIEHQVLNARNVAVEAEIVAAAGEPERVTVATNMAGRGTDIPLVGDGASLGGLHVICTELHESARIDRQLVGRCARQGDPGSYREFMSLEDGIVEAGLDPQDAARVRQRVRLIGRRAERLLRNAQRRVERTQLRQRKILLHHERERRFVQQQLGQDPYLDSTD